MNQSWTKEEIKIVQSLDNKKLNIDDIINMFNNRTYISIKKKANRLNIKWKIITEHHNAWTEEEKNIILNNMDNTEVIFKSINRNRNAIIQYLNNLNINVRNKRWLKYEDEYLKEHYHATDKDKLVEVLDRSWDAIKLRSEMLKLNRSHDFIRESEMSILLDGSNQTLYWLGFLLADGYFNFKSKRIQLTLAIKDLEHLKMYGKYINCNNINLITTNNSCNMSIQNIDIFDKIKDYLKLTNSNKTLNPNIWKDLNLTKEQMFCLIIGFIDGDGCILKLKNRKDINIRIQIHSTWLNNLIFIEDFIYDYLNIEKDKTFSKINNAGYASLCLSRQSIVNGLKSEVNRLCLNVLERKWNTIN